MAKVNEFFRKGRAFNKRKILARGVFLSLRNYMICVRYALHDRANRPTELFRHAGTDQQLYVKRCACRILKAT